MSWKEKFAENWTSLRWWVFIVASVFLPFEIITETAWLGITGVVLGVPEMVKYARNAIDKIKNNK